MRINQVDTVECLTALTSPRCINLKLVDRRIAETIFLSVHLEICKNITHPNSFSTRSFHDHVVTILYHVFAIKHSKYRTNKNVIYLKKNVWRKWYQWSFTIRCVKNLLFLMYLYRMQVVRVYNLTRFIASNQNDSLHVTWYGINDMICLNLQLLSRCHVAIDSFQGHGCHSRVFISKIPQNKTGITFKKPSDKKGRRKWINNEKS